MRGAGVDASPNARCCCPVSSAGGPGALLARRLLRHKTAKRSFRFAFRASIVVNLLALFALTSPWTSPLR